ncbi:hypothetical protein M0804_015559 [Polistes exclamans]|nr:hypothetical protein M0804_015559 [Polistes exclamans]
MFPKWDTRVVDEDRLGAALVSREWTRDDEVDLVTWVNGTLLISSDMSMPRVRMCANKSRAAPWWSRENALLRGAATMARRRYLRVRRGGDPVRIRECLETRREKKRDLACAIRRAKASAWKNYIATIEDDPWGRPYRMVMGKLGARGAPLTEALDPLVLERIVATLFPEGGRLVAPNVLVEEAEEIIVTIGEVRKAARRINLGRAPGPDGIPGLVVKSAATYCGRGLAECFTVLLRNGVFLQAWKRARLVLIKKKQDGDGSAPSTYRPICLLDEVGKLFERVVVSRVSEFLDNGNVLSPWQHGFRVGHSTLGAIEEVKGYIQECASDGRVGVLTLLDISNAFNSLPYETVIESMVGSGFPTYIGLNPESRRDPSVYWENPSESPRAEGEEAAPLQQRDPLRAPLWCSGVVAHCCGRSEGQEGCSGLAKKGSDQEAYETLRNAEGPVSPDIRASLGAFARMGAIAAWKEEEIGLVGTTGETGVRVRAAIADRLDEWVGRPYSIGTTFHTTQLMTGHGCFPAYLHGIRKTDSPRCFHCGADRDDAEHTLIECLAWTNARDSLARELGGVQPTLPGIVRLSLDTPGAWAAFQSFSGLVMKAKEDSERERERAFRGRRRVYARPQRGIAPRRPPRARLRIALAAPGLV